MAFSLLKAHQPTQAYYFPFQDIQAWSGDTAAFAVADSALWLDAPSGGTWTITWSDPLPVQSVDHWSCHVLPPKSARGAALWVLQWTASTGRVIRRSFPIIID